MSDAAVIIPFRDRGTDPLRAANLEYVESWWYKHMGFTPQVFDDGRASDAQFNRSAAYNRGVAANPQADVFVFVESDMIVPISQIETAIVMALSCRPGLVVPFSQYVALTPHGSEGVRDGSLRYDAQMAAYTMANCRAVGAVNVVSREALQMVGGYDEGFEGNWYDDNAMKIAFETTCGPTLFVDGSGYHLHHLPGWAGGHLSEEDKAATERNKARLALYEKATTAEQIRKLTRP